MLINGNITYSKSNITCSDSKWKIDNAEIEVKSIECVEKYDCGKIVPLANNSETNQYDQPSVSADLDITCEEEYDMTFVDESTGKDLPVSRISCDSDSGVWIVKDMANKTIVPPKMEMRVKCFPPEEYLGEPTTATPKRRREQTESDFWYIIAVVAMGIVVLIALWFTVTEILEFIKEIRDGRQEEARANAEQDPVVPSPGGLLTLEEVFGKYKYERFLKSVEKKLQ